ncbi:MAG TPA: glutamate--tRNA ligase [bacterium]
MVRTRFAPSPTGYLHIGGVRTALFNWLFARRHGGQFILRVDDTDQARNVAETLQPILAGFRWLGIDWDEGPEVGGDHGPYYQSQKLARYQAAARELVERGAAYYDYATPEEMAAERDAAQAAGRPFVYSRRWTAESEAQRQRFAAQGRNGAVRLKMPRDGMCQFTDLVRGSMAVQWIQEPDHVVQRADGTCLYHLANVVDDQDMGITHVIRAEEHLSNTPRQIFIAQALGYDLPTYAHLPYVAEPGSKNKLSKRKLDKYRKNPDFAKIDAHGRAIAEAIGLAVSGDTFNPVIVDFYEAVGYLPEAIINYLVLLGWSVDDRTESLSRDEMVELFSLERVNKAPASFDPAKLLAFQERYMQRLPVAARAEMAAPFVRRAGLAAGLDNGALGARVSAIVGAAGERIKVAGDILDYRDFFVPDGELEYDGQAFAKRLRKAAGAGERLRRFRDRLAVEADFTPAALEALMQGFVDAEGIGHGEIVHAVRVAVTGKAVGFGLFDILAILGRERCLARIDRALALLAESG